MARPTKQGVDYFPFDVHLDDKFKFIEIKYKLEGFAILVKLLQRIYSQGYWCKWSEDEVLLFSDEVKADHELVVNVVNECLKRNVFNQDLYDNYKILTSSGIQKRYKEIVRRRKDVDVTEEYTLVDDISRVIDDINPASSMHSDGKSTQSKVNNTKEDKTSNSPKQVYDESSLYFKMANYFQSLILNNNPERKEPDYQKWSDEFRKLVELDKRNKDQVRNLMEWIHNDDFEKTVVLSPAKLRKRYDDLYTKYLASEKKDPISRPFRKTKEQIEHEKMLEEMGY